MILQGPQSTAEPLPSGARASRPHRSRCPNSPGVAGGTPNAAQFLQEPLLLQPAPEANKHDPRGASRLGVRRHDAASKRRCTLKCRHTRIWDSRRCCCRPLDGKGGVMPPHSKAPFGRIFCLLRAKTMRHWASRPRSLAAQILSRSAISVTKFRDSQ